MLERIATLRFWLPGRVEVAVFIALVALGLVIRVLGTPSVASPLFGEAFYERAYGFPFYFGMPWYAVLCVIAGFVFPRCFYLWGVAVMLHFPFFNVWLALWLDSGSDDVWYALHAIVMVIAGAGFAALASVLSGVGTGTRILTHRLYAGRW